MSEATIAKKETLVQAAAEKFESAKISCNRGLPWFNS